MYLSRVSFSMLSKRTPSFSRRSLEKTILSEKKIEEDLSRVE
jgi:hypothetical protein